MNQTLVLYHGGCRDGFCAAWVVNKYFTQKYREYLDSGKNNPGEITYTPAFYGQDPPDVTGKDVIIVDFCYDYNMMLEIISDCKSLTWLDHHKTAKEFADFLGEMINHTRLGSNWQKIVDYRFLLENSGAGIAWDYFFPNEPRPWLVDYVEDRDLWAKKLNNTDVVNAYIACLEFNFTVWDDASELDVEDVAKYGQIAEMKTEQYVREVCKNMYMRDINQSNIRDVEGHIMIHSEAPDYKEIPIVNICQVDCSEVLHELCKIYPNSPFSLYWFKRADGLYQYGIRSIGDFDCSVVAKLFGGGGHKNAAGFQLPYLLEELK